MQNQRMEKSHQITEVECQWRECMQRGQVDLQEKRQAWGWGKSLGQGLRSSSECAEGGAHEKGRLASLFSNYLWVALIF